MTDKKTEKATLKAHVKVDWNSGDIDQAKTTVTDSAGNSMIIYSDHGTTGAPSPHGYEVRDARDRTLCVGDDDPTLQFTARGNTGRSFKAALANDKPDLGSILTGLQMVTTGLTVELPSGSIPGICKTAGKGLVK